MTDLAARADRVQAITEAVHGKVIGRSRYVVTVEIPADIAPGLARLWGEGGFVPIYQGQTTGLAPRRVINTQGHTIICDGDMITQAYYIYSINLRPAAAAKPALSPADITRPTRPCAG